MITIKFNNENENNNDNTNTEKDKNNDENKDDSNVFDDLPPQEHNEDPVDKYPDPKKIEKK